MNQQSITEILRTRFTAAIRTLGDEIDVDRVLSLRPAGDPKFGDFQCNAAMPLGKTLGQKPREIAEKIKNAVDLADIAEPLEIAGPGFLNIRLLPAFLAEQLAAIEPPAADADADRCGIAPGARPLRVVVDYSSPNIAKQMHVGHLRSTIIGDTFARVLGFLGHEVIRQNHVGDWGTQFGMLIAWYQDRPVPTAETHDDVLGAIEVDYRAAQARFKNDAEFADAARAWVGKLQGGDAEARRIWELLCRGSREAFLDIYRRLNTLLTDADVAGESFYNDRLASVVDDLRGRFGGHSTDVGDGGRVEYRVDDGAQCLFLFDGDEPRFKNADGEPLPMIIQKSDGAFLYATTDLAAVRYRIEDLGADRIAYVTDARQRLHFEMLFATTKAAGWGGGRAITLEHPTFGSVLGDDKKPLKTRDGQNVKLRELLDEAERRAGALLDARAAEGGEDNAAARLDEAERAEIARRVGIAAVKYADLSRDRNSDYVFSWDKLLAMQGNTAPYMMYAYARIRSIYRKVAASIGEPDVYADNVAISLAEPAERALALKLLQLPDVIAKLAEDLLPHSLCTYLYDLAGAFMQFYESCPVLQAPDDATRLSRMRLCDLTARELRLGLRLLGIETIERM